ncbi:SDR family NAD(P)-dependent oxidoreductase [Bacteroidota bacterium]
MNKEKKHVLITGASSGIGLAIAKKFAKDGYPLIFVARNNEKLQKIASEIIQEFGVEVITISQDLSIKDAASNIFNKVKELDLQVNILVNNAGFNEMGHFTVSDLKKEIDLIQVHISIVIELTKLFLPEMIKNGYGRIVNLGSVGSFLSVPNNAVYCAAKTFTYYFSNAIRHELRKTGVKVTSLCPGATNTNFHIEAEMSDLRMFNILPMTPEKVAKIAYPGILKGKRKIIPGIYNKILAFTPIISPIWLTNRITDWMYQPIN